MEDEHKTRDELLRELKDLRRRVSELESARTESLQTEEALSASERKFRSFIEQSWDLITLFDEKGCLSEWNKACEQLTGLTKQELSGKTFPQVVQAHADAQ